MKKEAEFLYKILKDDPEATIAWAKKEIEKYEELIKLVEYEQSRSNTKNVSKSK